MFLCLLLYGVHRESEIVYVVNFMKFKVLSNKTIVFLVIIVIISCVSNLSFAKNEKKSETTFQTQAEMNEQAYQIYKKTDKELNDVYKQILIKYKDDKEFISKLQKAELAWIKYRDAEIEAIYPEEDKSNYGSVYPMCVNQIMTEITRQRIKELKLWLKGICEGDVCAGSRKWE